MATENASAAAGLVGGVGEVFTLNPTSHTEIGGPYGINGVGAGGFDPNSAMYELAGAIGQLSGNVYNNNLEHVDLTITSLEYASYRSKEIAECFANVNKTVSSAWTDTNKFMDSVNSMVKDLMIKFTNEMKVFIEKSQYNEAEISQSATTANELADQILKDLNSSFNDFYNNNN